MTEAPPAGPAEQPPAPPREAEKLGREVRPIAVSHFVTYLGDGLFYVCAALYFTRVVGLTPFVYGAALTASWLVAMAVSVPVGHLADRFESRSVAMWMLGLAGASIAVYLVTSNVVVFFVTASLLAVCTQGAQSSRAAVVARTFPPGQVTRVRAVLISTANAGLALGAALGGLVIAVDTAGAYRLAFALDAATFFLAAALLLRVPATRAAAGSAAADGTAGEKADGETAGKSDEGGVPGEISGSPFRVFRDGGYVAVGVLNMLLTLHVPLIDVALPLWITKGTQAPAWTVAAVFVVNTALVVLLQYRVSKRVTDIDAGLRVLRTGGVLLFLGMALYSLSGLPSGPWAAAGLLLCAVTVLTFGELRQTSSMNEISFRLVPDGRYGQYQGFFGMGTTVAEAVGPLLLTWLLLYHGIWGWLILGGVFLAASLAMPLCVAVARRSPLVRENAL
ncbi:MFS transporter [Streptomyces sp. Amel2xB2]|uniref:MFS transporter n=1 Tax=Streptomyces sp. Amel2xB2 TaxID=1305829 RepID=UPI000DBFA14B|nr:MFS transporter [Streptomyces sp. Amel2xB2]RAJ60489.1 MFS transporter [Streptomyces sp. Amel2xB2]